MEIFNALYEFLVPIILWLILAYFLSYVLFVIFASVAQFFLLFVSEEFNSKIQDKLTAISQEVIFYMAVIGTVLLLYFNLNEINTISQLIFFIALSTIISYCFINQGKLEPNYKNLNNLFGRIDNKYVKKLLNMIKKRDEDRLNKIKEEKLEQKKEERRIILQKKIAGNDQLFLEKHPPKNNKILKNLEKIVDKITDYEWENVIRFKQVEFDEANSKILSYWNSENIYRKSDGDFWEIYEDGDEDEDGDKIENDKPVNILIFPDSFLEYDDATLETHFNKQQENKILNCRFDPKKITKLNVDDKYLKIFNNVSHELVKQHYHRESNLIDKINNKIFDIEDDIKHIKEDFPKKIKPTLDIYNKAKNASKEPLKENIEALCQVIDLTYKLPKYMTTETNFTYDEKSQILLVDYLFPDYEQVDLEIGDKNKRKLTEKQKSQKIRKALYSIVIRYAFLLSRYNFSNAYQAVAINIHSKWVDKATGQNRSGVISSFFGKTEELKELVVYKLDPEKTFNKFKGIITPEIDNTTPIKPIYTVDKNDKRIVETKNVSENLEENTNLAAIEWEDFESLVAQLFEWEFASQGNEVKVTQASRDKGIDAIMFDPDPIKGGKYVLQAKRYTNVVDVSAVRDLYGTMLNEGANKGIIITTSSYGKDAYEFAKDKPLSLVDGRHLIDMLHKHGKNYKIDLAEAKKINKAKEESKRKSS